jgi:hypothetical protein
MNTNPHFTGYNQSDIRRLYSSGSIVPNIDSYGNLVIQNTTGQLYSSSITIPLVNAVYNSTKVQTKYDVNFTQL